MSFEGSYGTRAIASTLAATTEANSGRVLNKNASFGSDNKSSQVREHQYTFPWILVTLCDQHAFLEIFLS